MIYVGIVIGIVIGLGFGAILHIMDSISFINCIEMNVKRNIPEKIGNHWYQLTRIDRDDDSP